MNPYENLPNRNESNAFGEPPEESPNSGEDPLVGAGQPELGRIRSRRRATNESYKSGADSSAPDYRDGDDDDLPPLVVGEGRSTSGLDSNRLLTLLILLMLVVGSIGAAVWIWNKRQVERRAAAILAGLENTGGDDSGGAADSSDRYSSTLNLRWPIYDEISSPYGYRVHPISKEKKLHNGIDIAAPYWKEVFAAGNGKVEWAARKGGKGNTVIIRHNKRFQTYYCHLQKCKVKKGEEVLKGDLIGWVGSTGYSRGPHLHLELHKNGVPVDPAPYLPEPTEAMLKRLKEKGIETFSD